MAHKASSFLVLVIISNILLAPTWRAIAARNAIPKNSNTDDKRKPQWFFNSDGGVFIPGIDRVGLSPLSGFTPQNPFTGGSSRAGTAPARGTGGYVLGGDDTFVPNPGFEVPNPGSVGGVPATVRP